ncbi:MAG: protein phosphatase 2C domain-containing protein [Candidatus Buchananbacteria bacterium]
MKVFSLTEGSSSFLVEWYAKQIGANPENYKHYIHPQEDYLLMSQKYPIAVVADGVTLEFQKDGKYPNPSGAGELAKIFCETIIEATEDGYDNLSEEELVHIFRKGNEVAGQYNQKNNRTKENSNFLDYDLFAATCVFACIKDKKVFWASLCDARFLHLDKNGKVKFASDAGWNVFTKNLPSNWNEIDKNEKKIIVRSKYRNGLDINGNPIGYGVVTGDEAAEKYLNFGSREVEEGDIIILCSDGFYEYFENKDFVDLLLSATIEKLEPNIKDFILQKSKEEPDKYGHEKTLIAIFN